MIWYSTDDDRLVIEGALQTYAPRTLMVVCDGDQIMVRLKVNVRNEYGPAPYTDITDNEGNGFADCASAVAYLTGIFAMRLSGQPGPRGPGILSGSGEPDPSIGLAGDLYLDAISGDLFSKGV